MKTIFYLGLLCLSFSAFADSDREPGQWEENDDVISSESAPSQENDEVRIYRSERLDEEPNDRSPAVDDEAWSKSSSKAKKT